jgi:pyruvate dehydrogenase E1 component alpha subunit
LIEAKTYRFRGHEEGDEATYRTAEELEAFLARDPINAIARHLSSRLGVSVADLEAVSAGAVRQVAEAYEVASAAPWPEPHEVLDDVYVSY